jgi:hypothetical protein
MHLGFLMDPFGDEPHRRQREQSVAYLLAHAAEAYPRLLAALQANPTALNAPCLIEVLPLFGRTDNVPLLEDILARGSGTVCAAAGDALGRHPDAGAREALLRGLGAPRPETVTAAVDGLMVRGDPSVCPVVKSVAGHRDPIVRYHAVRAAGALGCLSREEIEDLEKTDPDLDIRNLARELRLGEPRVEANA